MRTIADIANYHREYKAKIRATRFPAHEYVRPSHCRVCLAEYNRRLMAAKRKAMRDNEHGTYHDLETELIDETKMRKHNCGECKGAPECGACLDQQAEIVREDCIGG